MKKIALLVAAVLMAVALVGCTTTPPTNTPQLTEFPTVTPTATAAPRTTVNLALLKGPTGIGAVPLMKADEAGTTLNDYNVTLAGANDEITAALINGTADMAAVATNLAAVLNKRTNGNIRIIAVNTLGVLHVLEKGETVTSAADLRGKTVVTSGQGAVPEYVLNFMLTNAGLTVGTDVQVIYKSEHAEVVAAAAAGQADVVMLPEPFATNLLSKNIGFRRALDVSSEYKRVTGQDMAMGCIVARADWAAANPKAIADFLTEYGASTRDAVANAETTADGCVEYGIIPAKPVALSAIPNCNIVCVTGEEMKTLLGNFYTVLHTANPASVGGAPVPSDIYYVG